MDNASSYVSRDQACFQVLVSAGDLKMPFKGNTHHYVAALEASKNKVLVQCQCQDRTACLHAMADGAVVLHA